MFTLTAMSKLCKSIKPLSPLLHLALAENQKPVGGKMKKKKLLTQLLNYTFMSINLVSMVRLPWGENENLIEGKIKKLIFN